MEPPGIPAIITGPLPVNNIQQLFGTTPQQQVFFWPNNVIPVAYAIPETRVCEKKNCIGSRALSGFPRRLSPIIDPRPQIVVYVRKYLACNVAYMDRCRVV